MTWVVSLGIVACGIIIIIRILHSIVQKQITETHGLFWLVCALVIVVGGASPTIIIRFASLLGVDYAPAIIFTAAILMLFYLVFRCTQWISDMTMRVQELGMQVSLLNQENMALMAKVEELEEAKKADA